MDRSLKERVIGASVLVGLAVWLIPWVLDGPVPDAETGAAWAPSAEPSAPLRTRTIRLEDQQAATAPVAGTDIPGTPEPRASDEGAGSLPEITAAARPDAPATPSMSTTADVLLDASSGSAATAAVGSHRPVANEPDAPSSAGAASSAEPTAAASGWVVQVGSFGDEENARRQAGRLADAGYTARLYPVRSGGRLMYRVRVGPGSSREGADEIASSLRDEGFVAQAVSGD